MRGGHLVNAASPYIAEYNVRRRLAELGYTTPFEKLDTLTALVFLEIESVRDDQIERDRKRQGRR